MAFGVEQRGKLVIGGLMIGILAMALIFLQQQFDQGDLNRAITLLMSKPPGAEWSVAEELNARAGQGAPQCEPKILSSFAGTLEVECFAGPSAPYRFSVDLVQKAVRPLDLHTQELMGKVQDRTQGASPDGGP